MLNRAQIENHNLFFFQDGTKAVISCGTDQDLVHLCYVTVLWCTYMAFDINAMNVIKIDYKVFATVT